MNYTGSDMKVLIVLAHPEPQSFNAALKSTAVKTLQKGGHEVTISDLYAMGWQAALSADDFVGERADKHYLNLSREQEHAFANNTLAAQVKAEQDKVSRADLVLFHFPVWWFSMPGILKGWVDRVFRGGSPTPPAASTPRGISRGKRQCCVSPPARLHRCMNQMASTATCTTFSGQSTTEYWLTQALPYCRRLRLGCRPASPSRNARNI